MAKNKYYAVRKGITTGIFEKWADCQAATAGYSNAEFKSFYFFEPKGSKYQLKSEYVGTASSAEIAYLGRCYTFYHNNRHILEHWDDPTAPLDTTKVIDCNQAHDLIKRTLEVIDDFYSI